MEEHQEGDRNDPKGVGQCSRDRYSGSRGVRLVEPMSCELRLLVLTRRASIDVLTSTDVSIDGINVLGGQRSGQRRGAEVLGLGPERPTEKIFW